MLDEEVLNLMDEEDLKGAVKSLLHESKEQEALKVMEVLVDRFPSEKNRKRLVKLQEHLENEADEDDEEDEELEGNEFKINPRTAAKLYPYQIEGIMWLWTLFQKKKGGILGDDMGMGKTVQMVVFLSTLFQFEKIKCALIIMPVTLIKTWEKEFDKWAPKVDVIVYHEVSKNERERLLSRVQRRGGVMLTTYGLIVTSAEQFGTTPVGRQFTWDYVILDEGHKIKNITKTNKGTHAIPARNRIVLSGTPIQNNLQELWVLFDFAHHGTLLGTMKTFKLEFEDPIKRSREKGSTVREQALGTKIAESLRKIIEPYFLRRTKALLLEQNKSDEPPEGAEGSTKRALFPTLGEKKEFVIWTYLTELQISLYKSFLTSDDVQEVLMSKKSPLVQLTYLKKICDHPRLIANYSYIAQSAKVNTEELERNLADVTISELSPKTILQSSGKMQFLLNLCENLRSEGHRTLIFSQSRKILDMIEKILDLHDFKTMRIDGTVLGSERETRVAKFQRNPSIHVCLLTVQVGGVGLTLTAADRVIIYDPSWNPGTDAQAVDRVYRIGQKKPVVVYRLITCGTVEEKIYRRQVFKTSLTVQMVGKDTDPFRYFTGTQIRELFKFEDPYKSETQMQLNEIHGRIDATTELQDHMEFLKSLNIFGLSFHTMMFTEKNPDAGELDAAEHNMIAARMEQATLKVNLESQMHTQFKGANGNEYSSVPATGKILSVRPKVQPSTTATQDFKFQKPTVVKESKEVVTELDKKSAIEILDSSDEDLMSFSVELRPNEPYENEKCASGSATNPETRNIEVDETLSDKILPSNSVDSVKSFSDCIVILDESAANIATEVAECNSLPIIDSPKREQLDSTMLLDNEMMIRSPDTTLPTRLASTPAHGLRVPIVDPVSPKVLTIEESMNALSMMETSQGVLEGEQQPMNGSIDDEFIDSDSNELIADTSDEMETKSANGSTAIAEDFLSFSAFEVSS